MFSRAEFPFTNDNWDWWVVTTIRDHESKKGKQHPVGITGQVSPHNELASTKYCLAAPGSEYFIYLPVGGAVTVDLAAANVEFSVEWFDPNNRKTVFATSVTGGAWRELKAPFKGPAVLYLHSTKYR
jgi:hypothetical protein